ncbi:peroxiredoxin-like family protein [uncultured Microscilla sp.]|uniref:peroxiredoxin-like family protein n=1 Tax=uncultured Microscilla sp. TaxID=432653 RepID=UPI00262A0B27|nr:peroxiredoxin-like family protein [uncultured Microscilla sp.]
MNFQQRLQSIKERIEGNLPADYLKVMHGATEDLKQSGIQEKVLKPGQKMPAFNLLNQDQNPIDSQQLLNKGALVITFYRGVWCPYCNADLANLKKYVTEINAAGAKLIAVSPEQPQFLKKISDMQKLNFDILHDANNELAAAFGLKFTLPEDLKVVYHNQFNIDLTIQHGNSEWALPMPARFLVNQAGIIQYAESEPDYRNRPDPDELMEVMVKVAGSN